MQKVIFFEPITEVIIFVLFSWNTPKMFIVSIVYCGMDQISYSVFINCVEKSDEYDIVHFEIFAPWFF